MKNTQALKIVSIKPVGPRQTFCLEVDHPDHNFILANQVVSGNSHSIAYSYLTYICAFLKGNYAAEFFCALMSVRSRSLQPKDWSVQAPQFIQEAKILGVDIRPPSINKSNLAFSTTGNQIYFGFSGIRNVGKTAGRMIVEARGNTPFSSVEDFVTRVNLQKVNSRAFEALVHSGCFDALGYNRDQLLNQVREIYDYTKSIEDYYERIRENAAREKENEKLETLLARRNELRRIQRLKRERALTPDEEQFLEETKGLRKKTLLKLPENKPVFPSLDRTPVVDITLGNLINQGFYIGCFIGTHPIDIIYPGLTKIVNAEEGYDELAGVVLDTKYFKDRNKKDMAFIDISDGSDIIRAVIFSRSLAIIKDQLTKLPEKNDIVKISGKIQERNSSKSLLANQLEIYRGLDDL